MGATDPGIDDGEASGKTAVDRRLSAAATASRLLSYNQVNYSTYPAVQRYTSSAATTPVNVALTASVITTPVAIPTVVYTPPPCAATGWGVR
ncbi:hypothetical protein AB0C15_00825 [Micromonospora sp. NPDC048835]|uniref:hypothetical protein n=1 Tax=Micromonospora sp. NPDC048835 TaxID=3155147 RepID=UPI0033E02D79